MHLTYRPAGIADVACCLDLLPQGFALDPPLRDRMRDLWQGWVRDESLQMAIVEDDLHRTVGFGCSHFVNDEFAADHGSFVPPIADHVCRLHLAGKSPILSVRDVKIANTEGGLNLLVPVIGVARRLDAESATRVRAKLLEAFFYIHAGYNIKTLIQEIYGDSEKQRAQAIGATVLAEVGSTAPDHEGGGERIFYIGVSRKSVAEGSAAWPLFLYQPPAIFFTPAEQGVLKLALLDLTDAEIAASLGIAPSTVHKKWRAILARASASGVSWLPLDLSAHPSDSSRGPERRRHLVRYLRSHPEELRPTLPKAPRRQAP